MIEFIGVPARARRCRMRPRRGHNSTRCNHQSWTFGREARRQASSSAAHLIPS
jgi:hypothetical protein